MNLPPTVTDRAYARLAEIARLTGADPRPARRGRGRRLFGLSV